MGSHISIRVLGHGLGNGESWLGCVVSVVWLSTLGTPTRVKNHNKIRLSFSYSFWYNLMGALAELHVFLVDTLNIQLEGKFLIFDQ